MPGWSCNGWIGRAWHALTKNSGADWGMETMQDINVYSFLIELLTAGDPEELKMLP